MCFLGWSCKATMSPYFVSYDHVCWQTSPHSREFQVKGTIPNLQRWIEKASLNKISRLSCFDGCGTNKRKYIISHMDNGINGQTLGIHYTRLNLMHTHFPYPCHITRRVARASKFQHNTIISFIQNVSQVGGIIYQTWLSNRFAS